MSPEHAKKMLPIITAFAEGKPVQFRLGSYWTDSDNLSFDILPPEDYRIKPEPRAFFHVEFRSRSTGEIKTTASGQRTFAEAVNDGRRIFGPRFIRVIKFVEAPE